MAGGVLSRTLCLTVVVLAMGACDLDRGPLGTGQTTSPATTAPTTRALPAAPKDTRSAKLARLFTGLTSQSVVGYRLVDLPAPSGLELREPPEWKTVALPSELRLSREKDVVVVFRIGKGAFEVDAAGEVAKSMKLTDLAWGEPVDGQLGGRRLPGKMSDGMARLHDQPAEVWYFAHALTDDRYLLVVAAVKREVAELRAALLDCLKSVRPKR